MPSEGLHSVAPEEHRIEVVGLNPPFDGQITLELNCRKISDSCHICEFCPDGVANVFADRLHVSMERECHLLAC